MEETAVPRKVHATVQSARRALILGHLEPDGDCIGACIALASYLNRRGAETWLFDVGPFDRREIQAYADSFRPRIPEELQRPDSETVVIVLDCSTPERLGELANDIQQLRTVVVDHHPAGVDFGTTRWVEPLSPATCYLVQLLIEANGDIPTPEEARLLLFGIATDTGFFRHLTAEQSFVFSAIARLGSAGASPKAIHRMMYGGRTLASRKLLSRVLDRLDPHCDERFFTSFETKEDTDQVGMSNRDSESFYQLVFSIETCEALAFLREEAPNRCTGSLRSRDYIDVSSIAEQFGGGGHKHAAGFLVERPYQSVMPEVIAAFRRAFAEADAARHSAGASS